MKPYEGKDGYIFISYSHRDAEEVVPVIERLLTEGYRVWYDEGITPGTEWDENIAKHMEDCDGVVAFLSENYLGSENCKDELNYARDLEKNRLLVYLDEITLPSGMAMRLNRSQAILKYRYENTEDFYEELTRAPMVRDAEPVQGGEETAEEENAAAEAETAVEAEVPAAAEENKEADAETENTAEEQSTEVTETAEADTVAEAEVSAAAEENKEAETVAEEQSSGAADTEETNGAEDAGTVAETQASSETAETENAAQSDTSAERSKPGVTVGQYVLENCVVENAEAISKTESVTAVVRAENVPTDGAGNVIPVQAVPAPKKKGVPVAAIVAVAVLAVALVVLLVFRLKDAAVVIKPETAADIDLDWDGGDWTDRDDVLAVETEEGYIVFGAYEQDGKTSNGPEPIEWEVLEKDDEHTLLVSRYVLDCLPYNEDDDENTWEDSSLREWLNDDFIDQAFTEDEQELIENTSLKNPDNEYWDTPGGNKTKDKVFLLSMDDLFSYYDLDEWYPESEYNARWGEDNVGYCERLIIVPTEYAIDNGVDCMALTRDDYKGSYYDDWDGLEAEGYSRDCIGLEGSYWWIRTPGFMSFDVCFVSYDGYMGWGNSMSADLETYGVRPALYISR